MTPPPQYLYPEKVERNLHGSEIPVLWTQDCGSQECLNFSQAILHRNGKDLVDGKHEMKKTQTLTMMFVLQSFGPLWFRVHVNITAYDL